MSGKFRVWGCLLIVGLCLVIAAPSATAKNATAFANSAALSSFSLYQEDTETTVEKTEITTIEEEKAPSSPFSFDITYYLYSDYVFRGINFSEYAGEGREKLNHQMTTEFSIDVGMLFGQSPGTCGTFTFETFFEWFAEQKKINPDGGGQNLQEVDYLLSYSYEVVPIYTTFTLGYTFYSFPNDKVINTSEWWFRIEHNDAWMWAGLFPDNKDGILNPYFLFAQDVGVTGGGCWMELGVSHDFALFENFTLTPSMVFGLDHRYIGPLLDAGAGSTGFANITYGLNATYDLAPVLNLPDWMGELNLSGFLYFSDAVGSAENSGLIQDEFYGGMSIGWSF